MTSPEVDWGPADGPLLLYFAVPFCLSAEQYQQINFLNTQSLCQAPERPGACEGTAHRRTGVRLAAVRPVSAQCPRGRVRYIFNIYLTTTISSPMIGGRHGMAPAATDMETET
jgi:hypothetical protein